MLQRNIISNAIRGAVQDVVRGLTATEHRQLKALLTRTPIALAT